MSNTEKTLEEKVLASLPRDPEGYPVFPRFTSKMKHHVINRPSAFQGIGHGPGGYPMLQKKEFAAIEFKNGVFIPRDVETLIFLRNHKGPHYGLGTDYWEMPEAQRLQNIKVEEDKEILTRGDLEERLKKIEQMLDDSRSASEIQIVTEPNGQPVPVVSEESVSEDVPADAGVVENEVEDADKPAPKKRRKSTAKKALADTIEG